MYEMIFLSDLLKKSRGQPHPDFITSLNYIYGRLDRIGQNSPHSEFNARIRWLQKILPRFLLSKILYRLRYDAMMGFCQEEENEKGEKERFIYGMISFQKHPYRGRVGMFDIYISPDHRNKDLLSNFQKMAGMVYELSQRFQKKGYRYLQCGKNQTTRKLLELYQRVAQRNHWECNVDVNDSRIYLF